MSADSTRQKGRSGEASARRHLENKGYRILQMNFRLRSGEIDIIARDGRTLVFVEVKKATGTAFGDPLGWVPFHKQERIVRTSIVYVTRHGLHDSPIRFDVVAIDPLGKVTHVKDAFRVPDDVFV